MEEAGAVDGDSVAGDAEGDNAEHGGGHKHRLAEHAVEPDGGGPSAAPAAKDASAESASGALFPNKSSVARRWSAAGGAGARPSRRSPARGGAHH